MHKRINCVYRCEKMANKNLAAVASEIIMSDQKMNYGDKAQEGALPIYPFGPYNRPVVVNPVSMSLAGRDMTTIRSSAAADDDQPSTVTIQQDNIGQSWTSAHLVACFLGIGAGIILFLVARSWLRGRMMRWGIRIIYFTRSMFQGLGNMRMPPSGGQPGTRFEPSGESAFIHNCTAIPESAACDGSDGNDFPPHVSGEPKPIKMTAHSKTALSSTFPPSTNVTRLDILPRNVRCYYENEIAKRNFPNFCPGNGNYGYNMDPEMVHGPPKRFLPFYEPFDKYFGDFESSDAPAAGTSAADEAYFRMLAWQWQKQLVQRQRRKLRLLKLLADDHDIGGNANGEVYQPEQEMGKKDDDDVYDDAQDRVYGDYNEGSFQKFEQIAQHAV